MKEHYSANEVRLISQSLAMVEGAMARVMASGAQRADFAWYAECISHLAADQRLVGIELVKPKVLDERLAWCRSMIERLDRRAAAAIA